MPLKGVPSQFGSWNFHAGADLFMLGDDEAEGAQRRDESTKVWVLFGIGVTY